MEERWILFKHIRFNICNMDYFYDAFKVFFVLFGGL